MAEHRNGNVKNATGKASGASNPYAINLENFSKRLKMLYSHWNEHDTDLWGASDALSIATPPTSEDLRYLKSSALNIWLLGYEFPETIMVFMKKQIHILCSQKKASLLDVVKRSAKEAVDVEVVMHVKPKNDDGAGLMDSIFHAINAQSKSNHRDGPVIGHIARETPEGKLLETWAEKLKHANYELSDVTNGFSNLFAVKDNIELTNVKKAAFLTSSVMRSFVVPRLEKIIDEEKKVSHSSLMDDTEKAILEPARIKSKAYEVLLKAQEAAISTLKSGNRLLLVKGPREKEMITALHFHLHNHIMVGNKKTKDVQFYVEVMDVVQTLGGGKRSAYDPDEIEEEQRERDRKNKINMDFQNFVNRAHDLWGQPQFKALDLEFDQPLRELGFHGVPHKASAFIVPTSSCLVELIETPFVVITLNEIEIVNLERVGLGQKNFDMTIVFKDFKRDVFRIDSIPSSSLDGIKEWLDTTDLKYYESRLNLNWRPILKTITDDPEKFIEDGGWEFLNMDISDSDSENSESDQGYEPSDVQSDSGSEDEDHDSESLVESEDDEEEDSEEDSEEDEGKTWEELEREASYADREKGDDSDSEVERTRRKMKAFGKARPPSKRPPGGSLPKRAKLR
ncbi:FACT complex subunit SPT16 [Morella rubra]|uniref:FACT complex subunit n=1 Tax=Morella rubra TaxID=262757 RepID=A0A6A1USN8_9ROSI|nr:FACT complex subunit SPT16 [Morella rubra]